jgi:oligopeptide/dipeptide ABC transporter ATP-binding protein
MTTGQGEALPLLQAEGLSIAVPTAQGPALAVRGASFCLEAGQTLGLVGESGCGKSLTALSLMGLLPPGARLAGGSIRFDGRELAGLDEPAWEGLRGRELAMVFQDPAACLNPVMRIGEQVAEALRLHQGLAKAAAWDKAVGLLGQVGIPEPKLRASQYPHQFSGGMRQRAMIAMALSCQPRLLIADEPTTALDVTVQAQILDLLKQLQKELGLAILLITHDLGIVARAADRLAVMYAGRVVEQGRVREVLRAPAHPYTQALLDCLPGLGRPLRALQGQVPELWDMPRGCAFAPRCSRAGADCLAQDPPAQELALGRQAACLHLEAGHAA